MAITRAFIDPATRAPLTEEEYNARPQPQTPITQSNIFHDGASRVDAAGNVEHLTRHSFSTADLSPYKNPQGSSVFGREVRGTDMITIGGMQILVSQARSLGLPLPADPYTTTPNSGAGGAAASANFTQAPADKSGEAGDGDTGETAATGEAFRADDATEANFTALAGMTSAGTQASILTDLSMVGSISRHTVERIASEAGVHPDEVQGQLDAAHAGMQDAVEARMATKGVYDIDLFMQWVGTDPRREGAVNGAMKDLLTTNAISGFDTLANAFAQELDTLALDDVATALSESGIVFGRGANGRLWVQTDAGQIGFDQAVKSGFLCVSTQRGR